ncbi:hypothetical protein GGQ05_001882 [Salinibacter ruber]|jgi:hypothetical protein|nr:hypothetical protein [Salinibacter ruber]MCS4170416.1 hypothetical protein [Salinibacter ruber]
MSPTGPTMKAIVPCIDANGVPTVYVATVHATSGEVDQGHHYPVAADQARREGFEVPSESVIIDREDASLSGGEVLFDLVVTAIERRGYGEGIKDLLQETQSKLDVAQDIVDPARENGTTVPFAQGTLERVRAFLERLR